ncbi:response regulator [uncultured Massilia sp.]|uniref:response regulator n=1 Tax=uncultured Massilia sp. TaxID=169973 RepID=UPI0025E0E95D|nr:response regulator [uncultured Massilia sp.]
MAFHPDTRVLIVDDNRDAAELLSDLLAAQGFVTATAYDGFMALDVALAFQPHIIVLDLGMPRFSGDEVAPMLRQLKTFEDVYIIALTSWDDSEARALTRRTGFDLHLSKPVDLSELFAALELGECRTRAFGEHGQAAAAA